MKYSLRTSDHNGWLLCNGCSYSSSQYPELYAAISGSFGTYLPNYSGYFLKAAATSYASTFKTAEQAGLPNITGTIYVGRTENAGGGAFKKEANTGSYSSHHDARDGGHYSFDASRSNSIYGKSSTVTPKNYSANVFIYAGRKKQ